MILNFMMTNVLKLWRLILQAIFITYILGCLWYLLSNKLNPEGTERTFVKEFGLDTMDSLYDRFITSCYFILTTLAVIGYGDLYAISNLEKIIGMIIMLGGVAFFSYIMGSFISIITRFESISGGKNDSPDLHNWMTLLTRFIDNKPLPRTLINEIDTHFQHYWASNRLGYVSKDNEFLNALPRSIKKSVIVHYIFDDVFYKFRSFFNTIKNENSKFLYDIAFGLKPRVFKPGETSHGVMSSSSTSTQEMVIYDEEDEVPEMYFIK